MFGDFSRLSYNARNRFSRVWMQQGRVQLDADWNEMVAIAGEQWAHLVTAVIGFAGAPTQTSGFAIGPRYGYMFDGQTTFVQVDKTPAALNFAGTVPFTIHVGLYFRGQDTPAVHTILSNARVDDQGNPLPQDGGYALHIDKDNRVVFTRQVELQDEQGKTFTSSVSVRTQVRLPPNRWTTITVAYDGLELALYLDRALAARQSAPNAGVAAADPVLLIGAQETENGKETRFFNGLINELRVWKRSFDQTEIAALMPLYSMMPDSDLVLNWDFSAPINSQNQPVISQQTSEATLFGQHVQVVTGAWISPGEYFVNGIRLVNTERISYAVQPYLPQVKVPTIEAFRQLDHLFFLDAWERYVSPKSDPALREVALEGLDTTARNQIVWQMQCIPLTQEFRNWLRRLPIETELHGLYEKLTRGTRDIARLMLYLNRRGNTLARGYLRAAHDSTKAIVENRLYRVEIHYAGEIDVGAAFLEMRDAQRMDLNPSLIARKSHDDRNRVKVTAMNGLPDDWLPGQPVLIYALVDDRRQFASLHTTIARVDAGADTVYLTDSLDPLPQDEDWRIIRLASMKWSRHNGAVIFKIMHIENSGNGLVVTLPYENQYEDLLRVQSWVEVIDDTYQLQQKPGPLYQISRINAGLTGNRIQVTLQTNETLPLLPNPHLQLWDGKVDYLSTGDIELEAGISVSFSRRQFYNAGDFWTIPARQVTNDIVWNRQVPYPPEGIEHCFAPISLSDSSKNEQVTQRDMRALFTPLTGRDTQPSQKIQPLNDLLMAQEQLIAEQAAALTASVPIPPGFAVADITQEQDASAGYWQLLNTKVPESTALSAVVVNNLVYCYWTQQHHAYTYGLFTSKWQEIAPLPDENWRWNFAVVVYQEKIYFIGGEDRSGKKIGRVDVYDPGQSAWSQAPDMLTPRSLATAVVGPDNRLYVFGGITGDKPDELEVSKAAEYFDGRTWHGEPDIAPLPQARTACGAAYLPSQQDHDNGGMASRSNQIYVVGGTAKLNGFDPVGPPLATYDVYDLDKKLWSDTQTLPKGVYGAGVIADNQGKHLYVIGGRAAEGIVNTTQVYATETAVWRQDPNMNEDRAFFGIVTVGERIYAVGGQNKTSAESRLQK